MFNIIKTTALSALIGLGALTAAPVAAQADGLYLNFGGHGGTYFGIRDNDRRGRCTARRALNKADRLGLHRTRIVNANRHRVKVRGRKFGNRVTVVFANRRGCPIIYR